MLIVLILQEPLVSESDGIGPKAHSDGFGPKVHSDGFVRNCSIACEPLVLNEMAPDNSQSDRDCSH